MVNDIIKIKAQHSFTLYPKSPKILGIGENTYGIVEWVVSQVIQGDENIHFLDRITITGTYETPIEKQKEYTLLAKEIEHEKYGKQYQLMFIGDVIDFSKVVNQRAFLSTILTEEQIKHIYEVTDNPLDILEKHDKDTLIKAWGIGDYIADRIFERYEQNKDNCNVYLQLDEYGLTPKFIQKLISQYHNPQKVIDIIKNNPYELCMEVEGIGFKTADSIAVNNGLSPYSVDRVVAYIIYHLEEIAQTGNSYITSGELTNNIFQQFGGRDEILEIYDENDTEHKTTNNIAEAIKILTDMNTLFVENNENKAYRKVYLTKYYNIEKEISEHLKRIATGSNEFDFSNWEENIKKQELVQGWTLTEEQKEGVKTCLEKQISFITGGAGCVDGTTEFFNGYKWKRIDEYIKGDKVLQYNLDGTGTLVFPKRYIKQPTKTLWHFETDNLDQCLSDNHNCIVLGAGDGNIRTIPFEQIRKMQNSNAGCNYRFMTMFRNSDKEYNISDGMIKLMVSAIYYGEKFNTRTLREKFRQEYKTFCKFVISAKDEKRLAKIKEVLEESGTFYHVENVKDMIYYFVGLPYLFKTFPEEFYNLSPRQMRVLVGELYFWNANLKRQYRIYAPTQIEADFLQYAFTNCGFHASIENNTGIYKKRYGAFNVKIDKHTIGRLQKPYAPEKCAINKVSVSKNMEYCFTVPSGMLILRRKNKIFITGNCGKTSVLSCALKALNCLGEGGKYSFAQCSLSGKAAARMSEVTGEEGYTIHRLLGYNPQIGFTYTEENPLKYDIVIIDEISLVGGEIFLSLLKAIKTGTKLIILGDMGQLESIGCLNLASDLYASDYIPTVELTKVHRQAAKSGIIIASKNIREQKSLCDNKYTGVQVLGELEDMILDVDDTYYEHREKIMQYYKDIYASGDVTNIMDIEVLLAVRERGDVCVNNLNKDIQEFINPDTSFNKKELVINEKDDEKTVLREGDKVMCIQNNYQTENEYGIKTPIFNGWMGILKQVDTVENKGYIYFDIIKDTVVMPLNEIKKSIILGYASTVHKYQGSSSKYIICSVDYTIPPMMLTKELVYTMITRAEKKCVLIAQNRALNEAIKHSGIADKNTFLQSFLN